MTTGGKLKTGIPASIGQDLQYIEDTALYLADLMDQGRLGGVEIEQAQVALELLNKYTGRPGSPPELDRYRRPLQRAVQFSTAGSSIAHMGRGTIVEQMRDEPAPGGPADYPESGMVEALGSKPYYGIEEDLIRAEAYGKLSRVRRVRGEAFVPSRQAPPRTGIGSSADIGASIASGTAAMRRTQEQGRTREEESRTYAPFVTKPGRAMISSSRAGINSITGIAGKVMDPYYATSGSQASVGGIKTPTMLPSGRVVTGYEQPEGRSALRLPMRDLDSGRVLAMASRAGLDIAKIGYDPNQPSAAWQAPSRIRDPMGQQQWGTMMHRAFEGSRISGSVSEGDLAKFGPNPPSAFQFAASKAGFMFPGGKQMGIARTLTETAMSGQYGPYGAAKWGITRSHQMASVLGWAGLQSREGSALQTVLPASETHPYGTYRITEGPRTGEVWQPHSGKQFMAAMQKAQPWGEMPIIQGGSGMDPAQYQKQLMSDRGAVARQQAQLGRGMILASARSGGVWQAQLREQMAGAQFPLAFQMMQKTRDPEEQRRLAEMIGLSGHEAPPTGGESWGRDPTGYPEWISQQPREHFEEVFGSAQTQEARQYQQMLSGGRMKPNVSLAQQVKKSMAAGAFSSRKEWGRYMASLAKGGVLEKAGIVGGLGHRTKDPGYSAMARGGAAFWGRAEELGVGGGGGASPPGGEEPPREGGGMGSAGVSGVISELLGNLAQGLFGENPEFRSINLNRSGKLSMPLIDNPKRAGEQYLTWTEPAMRGPMDARVYAGGVGAPQMSLGRLNAEFQMGEAGGLAPFPSGKEIVGPTRVGSAMRQWFGQKVQPLLTEKAGLMEQIGTAQARGESVGGLFGGMQEQTRRLGEINKQLEGAQEPLRNWGPAIQQNIDSLTKSSEAHGALEKQALTAAKALVKDIQELAPMDMKTDAGKARKSLLVRNLAEQTQAARVYKAAREAAELPLEEFKQMQQAGRGAAGGGGGRAGGRGGIGQNLLYAPWWWQVSGQYGGEQYKQSIAYGYQAMGAQAQVASLQGQPISAQYLQRMQTETNARAWRENIGIAAQKGPFAQMQSLQMQAMTGMSKSPLLASLIGTLMPFGQPAFFGAAMSANAWAPLLGGGSAAMGLGALGGVGGILGAGALTLGAGAWGGTSMMNYLGERGVYGPDYQNRGVVENVSTIISENARPGASMGMTLGAGMYAAGQKFGIPALSSAGSGLAGWAGGAFNYQQRMLGLGDQGTITPLQQAFTNVPYTTTEGKTELTLAPSQSAGLAAMWQQIAGGQVPPSGVTESISKIMTSWKIQPDQVDQTIGQEMMEALGFRGALVGSPEAAQQIPQLMERMGKGQLNWTQEQLVRRYVGPEAQWAGVDPQQVEEYMAAKGIAAGSTLRPTFAIQRETQKLLGTTPYDFSNIMWEQGILQGRPELAKLATMEPLTGLAYGTSRQWDIEDTQRTTTRAYQEENWKAQSEHLDYTIDKTKELWDIQDEMTGIDRDNQRTSMNLSIARAENEQKWYWSNFELYKDQWQEKFELDKKIFEAREQYWDEDFATQESHREQQHEWAQQDFTYQKSMFEMKTGWQQEDYDRAIRFATGRQKEDLMREKERFVITSNMQRNQMEEQRKRDEIRWTWTEEQAEKEQTRHEEMVALQREEFALRQSQFNAETALRQAQMEDQKKLAEDQLAFLKDQKADMETQYTLTDEQKALQRAMQEEAWSYQKGRQAAEETYQLSVRAFENEIIEIERQRAKNNAAYQLAQVAGVDELKTKGGELELIYDAMHAHTSGMLSDVAGGKGQEGIAGETATMGQNLTDVVVPKMFEWARSAGDMATSFGQVASSLSIIYGFFSDMGIAGVSGTAGAVLTPTEQFGGKIGFTGTYQLEAGERVIPRGGDTYGGATYNIHIHGGDPQILVPLMDKIMAKHGISFRDRIGSE